MGVNGALLISKRKTCRTGVHTTYMMTTLRTSCGKIDNRSTEYGPPGVNIANKVQTIKINILKFYHKSSAKATKGKTPERQERRKQKGAEIAWNDRSSLDDWFLSVWKWEIFNFNAHHHRRGDVITNLENFATLIELSIVWCAFHLLHNGVHFISNPLMYTKLIFCFRNK